MADPYPTTHSPSPLGRLIRHTIFELRVYFSSSFLTPSLLLSTLAKPETDWLGSPWFLHQLCLHFPNLTITLTLTSVASGILHLCCPLVLEAFPAAPPSPFPGSSDSRKSTPTLYQLTAMHSSLHWPYHVRAYLHGYLTHVSLCQVTKFHMDRSRICFAH